MVVMQIEDNNYMKIKTISARVTPKQKEIIRKKWTAEGFSSESEYVLACCLKGYPEASLNSSCQINRLQQSNPERIELRVTPDEKKLILDRFEKSGMKNLSRFVRNCCFDKPIVVIHDLKEFARELNSIGNNLNQITMLCHQGLIDTPDISQTRDYLKKIYEELVKLNNKNRLGR